jgi:hypothetical protein
LREEVFKKKRARVTVAAEQKTPQQAMKATTPSTASLSKAQVLEVVRGWQGEQYHATVLRSRPDDDRIVIRLADTAYGSVILKLWKRPGVKGFLRRITRTASVFREWRMSRHLQTAGVAAPVVLGYAMLAGPEWPYTEALISLDLGELTSGPDRVKALLAEGRLQEVARFESQLIDLTVLMIEHGVLDSDHSIANVALTNDGQLIRLDFELARSVFAPRMHPKLLGLMLGRLVVSYAFQVQPDTARAEQFAHRLAQRVGASRRILVHGKRFIDSRLERARTGDNIHLDLQLNW